jgi:tetratricopeptide (TPR) repeat protein
MYKQGNYQTAAAGFFNLMQQDSSFTAPRFFAGITQMELGDYSQAVAFLSGVITHSVEYRKEAQWYLGLSYLKTGDSSKAIACFEVLAGSEGFYQDQARTLLRRLK